MFLFYCYLCINTVYLQGQEETQNDLRGNRSLCLLHPRDTLGLSQFNLRSCAEIAFPFHFSEHVPVRN